MAWLFSTWTKARGNYLWSKIVRRASELGINPGGSVRIQAVGSIPDQYKNQLITDDAQLSEIDNMWSITETVLGTAPPTRNLTEGTSA